jgi:hypothetical protein
MLTELWLDSLIGKNFKEEQDIVGRCRKLFQKEKVKIKGQIQ